MTIYFIGIGGIGISALAQYYLERGHQVSGSDLFSSETTSLLKEKGAKLLLGEQKMENVPKGTDLVIYSPAVEKTNPELKKSLDLQAEGKKLKVLSYPEALGKLTKKYFTVAVCGTHGKSTTTSMLSLILIEGGLDPTVILGTKMKEFGQSNFRGGKSNYLLIEADEWKASFLNYWPRITVLLNIEKEHMDYYKNMSHIIETYGKFIGHLPEEGILVINGDDVNIQKVISNDQFSIFNKFSIINFQAKKTKEKQKIKDVLRVPGEHNVLNALAALQTARTLGVEDEISYQALSKFKGSWRRFEEYKTINYKLISDYAHHPTEIEATLKAVREKYPQKEIWCLFQPHQYQRTFYLFDQFVKVLKKVQKNKLTDNLMITDIFDVQGREKKEIKERVSSEKLAKLAGAFYIPKKETEQYLKKNLKKEVVLVIMGAGDIYKLAQKLSTGKLLTSSF